MLSNKIEKEKRVISLYKQGKTIREIVKEVHMSFGEISSIIKKYTGEEYVKEQDNKMPVISRDTQALKLFMQNKALLDVTRELDLNMDDAERIYQNYWKLKGLSERLC